MFVGMRESRGRGGQHRPGRRAVGFGFAGKNQIILEIIDYLRGLTHCMMILFRATYDRNKSSEKAT